MFKKVYAIIAKMVPEEFKSMVRSYDLERQRRSRLMFYEDMCKYASSGFIMLQPYEKKEKVFNGIEYYSQCYQDYFLDTYIFRGKENGFFLDVGGNDPIYINNTYFFEKNRNWEGLAFEPMPKMNTKWIEKRKIKCIQTALGSKPGETEFCEYEEDYMSGLSDNVDYDGKISNKYKVKISTLKEILKDNKIFHVDFMSLDVEGAELDVLKGIDFESVDIEYIVIENNKGVKREEAIRKFLISKNYYLKAKLWIDEVWELKKN